MEHVLDNPVWHMLCHDLAPHTNGTALAKRCNPNVFPGYALAKHSDAAYTDLAHLCKAGEGLGILEADPPQEIPGFEVTRNWHFNQLVCQQRTRIPEYGEDIVELSPADSADVLQLIELTQPGPFFPGLLAINRFIGIRQQGQLIAMAGERFRLPGYREVTAVCTHPDWRGRGYARLLSTVIAQGIWERGKTPFLHVYATNAPAYHIYDQLHFLKRGGMKANFFTRS